MAEHARLAKSLQVPQALVPENGQLWRLAPGPAELIDEVPSGRIHLDGRVLVAEGEGLAKARRAMAYAGLIAITLVLDGKGPWRRMPAVLAEGMPAAGGKAVQIGGGRHPAPPQAQEERQRGIARDGAPCGAAGRAGRLGQEAGHPCYGGRAMIALDRSANSITVAIATATDLEGATAPLSRHAGRESLRPRAAAPIMASPRCSSNCPAPRSNCWHPLGEDSPIANFLNPQSWRRGASSLFRGGRHSGRPRPACWRRARGWRAAPNPKSARMASRCSSCIPRISLAP